MGTFLTSFDTNHRFLLRRREIVLKCIRLLFAVSDNGYSCKARLQPRAAVLHEHRRLERSQARASLPIKPKPGLIGALFVATIFGFEFPA